MWPETDGHKHGEKRRHTRTDALLRAPSHADCIPWSPYPPHDILDSVDEPGLRMSLSESPMMTSMLIHKQATKRIGIMSAEIQYAGHWKIPCTEEAFEDTLHYNEGTRGALSPADTTVRCPDVRLAYPRIVSGPRYLRQNVLGLSRRTSRMPQNQHTHA